MSSGRVIACTLDLDENGYTTRVPHVIGCMEYSFKNKPAFSVFEMVSSFRCSLPSSPPSPHSPWSSSICTGQGGYYRPLFHL